MKIKQKNKNRKKRKKKKIRKTRFREGSRTFPKPVGVKPRNGPAHRNSSERGGGTRHGARGRGTRGAPISARSAPRTSTGAYSKAKWAGPRRGTTQNGYEKCAKITDPRWDRMIKSIA